MTLKERILEDMRAAMKSGDAAKRDTLRLIRAAIVNAEKAGAKEIQLDDAGVLDVLRRQAKQRRESIAEYKKAGREDLAEKESAELAIITAYLPAQLSRQEIVVAARQAIAQVGATSPAQMGAVMKILMPRLKGRADGKTVNAVVQELLSG